MKTLQAKSRSFFLIVFRGLLAVEYNSTKSLIAFSDIKETRRVSSSYWSEFA